MKNLILFISLSFLSVVSNIATAQLPDYVPADSLAGWWPFAGNANDLSVNTNNGTVSGAQPGPDRFGIESSAYDFSDPADHILVQTINQASFEGNFTVSAWVNFRNFNTDYPHIISGMNNYFALHGQGPVYYPNNEKVGFYTTSVNAIHQGLMVCQDPVSVSTWHNIIVNKYGSEVKMYIDNQLSASNTYENQPLMQGEGLYFGNFYGLNSNIDGLIDDIGIWQRSLSPEEMSNLFFMPNIGFADGTDLEMFSIMPNPARDYFTISEISGIPGSKLFVFIYNSFGKLVLHENIDRGNPVIRFKGKLSPGSYAVKITNEAGNFLQQKLLINF